MLNYQITFPQIQTLAKNGEADFLLAVDRVAEAAISPEVKVLLVSGPSGSGKTTCARLVCDRVKALGRPASPLSLDDFFYDIKDRKKDVESLESEEHLDTDMLYYCVHQLMAGEATHVPSFDFATQKRVFEGKQRLLRENELLVVEGIHALCPKVKEVFSDIPYLCVFVNLEGEYVFPDLSLSANTARLIRRIVRDSVRRGASPDCTLSIWQGFTEYENSHIIPEGQNAQFVISTYLEYEPYVLRKHVLRALELIDEDGCYGEFKQTHTELFKKLTAASATLVPDTSVLHEFMG